jgi:hypothetical protein
MRRFIKNIVLIILLLPFLQLSNVNAELYTDGFVQGLFGARLNDNNPTSSDYTASETRLQMRMESFGDRSEFFSRVDFVYDGIGREEYEWELREAYLKLKLGDKIDLKAGRQILTWGTGDLIFINDVFAKDYRSFFIGRDDQYLKAPQNALRLEFYNNMGNFTFVITPTFEANRLPRGDRLSYYLPGMGIVGTELGEMYYFDPPVPEKKIENSEIAVRFQKQVGNFNTALYFYRGFYKNPLGFDPVRSMPVYPKLNIYGASARGSISGGVLWLETGYMDSREDKDGSNPFMPNSSVTGLIGFEKQVATNLTANIQWQFDYMFNYDLFEEQQIPGIYYRDEVRHLLTSRVTKLLNSETVTLSGFVFYSPSDEDLYFRFSTDYKYTDEVSLSFGGNIFTGKHTNSEFGQFQLNDNLYLKMTYGF